MNRYFTTRQNCFHPRILTLLFIYPFPIFLFLIFSSLSLKAQHGLKAEYYNGIYFDSLVAEKYVGNLDQSWNRIPPVKGLDPHYCSIRWTGKLAITESREYVFSARVDDGIRVYIDDRLIINQWELNDLGVFEGKMQLQEGKQYDLKVEYFNALNEGEIRLLWNIPYEQQSWYQYFFEDSKVPIPIENLLYPDEPKPMKEVATIIAPAKPIKKKVEEKPIKVPPKKLEKKVEPPRTLNTVVTSEEAEKFIPKNIAFERGQTIILESSIEELNTFAKFMLDNSHVSVMIEGHTDPVGDPAKNLSLSKNRATKVAKYLVDKGIDSKRIQSEGYGGTRPLVVPKKGEYYPANRRVVFLLSGLD